MPAIQSPKGVTSTVVIGRVQSAVGGAPIARALVVAQSTAGLKVGQAVAKADGSFRIQVRAENTAKLAYRVIIDGVDAEVTGITRRDVRGATEVDLRVERILSRPDLSRLASIDATDLTTYRFVTGRLFRPDGSLYAVNPSTVCVELHAVALGSTFAGQDEFARTAICEQSQGQGAQHVGVLDGHFVVPYSRTHAGAQLVVLVFDGPTAPRTELGRSAVIRRAGANHTIDIVLSVEPAAPKARYDEIAAALDDLGFNRTQSNWAEGVKPKHLAVLRGMTEFALSDLKNFLAAAVIQAKTNLWIEPVFGMLQVGAPTTLKAFLQLPADLVQSYAERAVAGHHIGASFGGTIDDFVRNHAKARIAQAQQSSAPDSINRLVAPLLTAPTSSLFLEIFEQHPRSPGTFWSAVQGSAELAPYAAALREAVDLGLACMNWCPFIEQVRTSGLANKSIDGLVDASDGDLEALIPTTAPAMPFLPEGITGATEQERKANFIRMIRCQLDRMRPSRVLRRAILDGMYGSQPVGLDSHLSANPDFDFLTFSSGTVSQLSTEVQHELYAYRRMLRLVQGPNLARKIQVLRQNQLTSATRIASRSVQALTQLLNSAWPPPFASTAEVVELHARATHASRTVAALVPRHAPAATKPDVAMIPTRLPGTLPPQALKDAFDGIAACNCDEWISAVSPGAYYVDLMAWTKARNTMMGAMTPGSGRPELEHIIIDEASTYVAVPTIDIVNEILEYRVATLVAQDQAQPPPTLRHVRTTVTSEEARVTPEYRYDVAYEALAVGCAPGLPFARPLVEARLYLSHLGLDLRSCMRAWGLPGTPGSADSIERLGTDARTWQLIANGSTQAAEATMAARWGLAWFNVWQARELAGVGTAVGSYFLAATGLSFEQALDLFHTRMGNPQDGGTGPDWDRRRLRLVQKVMGDACAPSGWQLLGRTDTLQMQTLPDEYDFVRIDRFLRLWRVTGWTLLQLDKVLDALGLSLNVTAQESNDDLDLSPIAALADLIERTRLPIEELLAWASTIDTFPDRTTSRTPQPSLYQRVFLRSDVLGTVAASAFRLTEDNSDLDNTSADLADHRSTLAQLLGVDETSIDLWLSELQLVGGLANPTKMTLSTLSALYRRASLARHLALDAVELAKLRVTCASDPFASYAQALAFLEEVDALRRCGHSLDELHHLLRHSPSAPHRTPSDAEVAASLLAVRQAGAAADGPAARSEAVGLAVAHALDLAPAVVTALMNVDFDGADTSILAVLTAETFLVPSPPLSTPHEDLRRAGAPNQIEAFKLWERLIKVVALFEGWRLTVPELAAWLGASHSELLSTSALGRVATTVDTTFRDDVTRLISTGLLLSAARALPGVGDAADVLTAFAASAANAAAFQAAIVARTGWTSDAVDAAVQRFAIGGTVDLPRAMAALRLLAEAHRLRTDVATLTTLVDDPISSTTAASIVALARARHPDFASWRQVASPIQDRLRVAQRDALLAWLRTRSSPMLPTVTEADCMRSFLTDVNVSPCATTSRVQHATLSLQLAFEQGLYSSNGMTLSDEDRRAWAWMKNYRVWEAARKVFLWPENWLDPSVRRESTPLYESFSNKLTAAPIDDDRIEALYDEYLDGLGEVANLVPVALLREDADPTTQDDDVLHVLARTPAYPTKHYYRIREAGTRWLPWQVVPGGIESDHVVLAAHNRRLFCFWAVLKAESEESTRGEKAGTINRMSVSVHWMTHQRGRWSPVQVLSTIRPLTGDDLPDAPNCVRLEARHTHNGTLEVALFGVYQSGEEEATLPGLPTTATAFSGSAFASIHGAPVLADGSTETTNVPPQQRTYRKLRVMTFDEGSQCLATTGVYQPTRSTLAPLDMQLLAPENATVEGQAFRLSAGRLRVPDAGDPLGDVQATVFHASAGLLYLLPASDAAAISTSHPCAAYSHRRSYLIETRGLGHSDPTDAENRGAVDLLTVAPPSSAWFTPSPLTPAYNDDDDVIEADDVADVSLAEGMVRARLAARSVAAAGQTGDAVATVPTTPEFLVTALHHPYAERFRAAIARHGVFGLLKPAESGPDAQLVRQSLQDQGAAYAALQPSPLVGNAPLVEQIDFTPASPTGPYNWEVFVHMPWRIADQLAQEGRFDQALLWLETLFDPTCRTQGMAGAWRVKPLSTDPQMLDSEWVAFTTSQDSRYTREALAGLEQQIVRWREDPFDPHRIATLRPMVYQRAVVMKYLDVLIAWADEQFRRDTAESLNEATQLYVRASAILGPRPQSTACALGATGKSYAEITNGLPLGADVLAEQIENQLFKLRTSASVQSKAPTPHLSGAAYFGIPSNPKLEGYWDTLADRLFKLRHCQNFDGQMRALPLYEPPIDPTLLVRASAVGLDISTVMAGQAPGVPYYRFTHMLARAQALAGSVQRLGSALLSALEKKDAEALALLRGNHETTLLTEIRESRARAVDEANEALSVARSGLSAAKASLQHYEGLLEQGLLTAEETQFAASAAAEALLTASSLNKPTIAAIRTLPQVAVGVAAAVIGGGEQASKPFEGADHLLQLGASLARGTASVAGMLASNQRRRQEWEFARVQAEHQVTSADRQVLAAQIRLAIAKHELRTHERQVAQSREIHDWMQAKYTNRELYTWMAGQLSTLHRQTWQLALETARQAEACYQRERGKGASETSFIHLDAWDTGRKGLLAGECLQADLERMEVAYLKEDRREFELVKQVSLADLNGRGLVQLIEEGSVEFTVDEPWFDLDYPGHYFRRIQAVTLSMPTVAGRVAGVHAEVSLKSHAIRKSTDDYSTIPWEHFNPVEQIATSSGQDDAGVFTLDYRDPRYLPFERRGAISTWRVEFVEPLPSFDRRGLADVALNIRYTARQGTDTLRLSARALPTLVGRLGTLTRAFYASRFAPDAWRRFVEPQPSATATALVLPLRDADFPAAFRSRVRVQQVELVLVTASKGGALTVEATIDTFTTSMTLGTPGINNLPTALSSANLGIAPADLTLTVADKAALAGIPDLIDLIVVLHYDVLGT